MIPFRLSTPQLEGPLQVSKWLKVQILLDTEEMGALMQALNPVHIVSVSDPTVEAVISTLSFLDTYKKYVATLKEGLIPSAESFRRAFSCALSTSLDAFYALDLKGRLLVKPTMPVIQLQAHHFFYSTLDRKFHPMVLSQHSVSWGIQYSYPQLFQDPRTKRVVKVDDQFPNTALFTTLMRWMRSHTQPTPFLVEGVKTCVPMRIGKQALAWVSSHPQLKLHGIEIAPSAKL